MQHQPTSLIDAYSTITNQIAGSGLGRLLVLPITEPGGLVPFLGRGADAFGLTDDPVVLSESAAFTPDRIRQGHLNDMPFEDESFPVTLAWGGLDRSNPKERAEIFTELSRVTADLLVVGCVDQGTRDDLEYAAFNTGFRRHPADLSLSGLLTHDEDILPFIVCLQKIPRAAWERFPGFGPGKCQESATDLLRQTGLEAELQLARYKVASSFIRPHDVVVELACGTGHGAAIMWHALDCNRVVGVDSDPAAIDYAIACYGTGTDGLVFQQGNPAECISMNDNSVDLVVLAESPKNAEPVLGEAHRILKPGGRFIIGLHDCDPAGSADDAAGIFGNRFLLDRVFSRSDVTALEDLRTDLEMPDSTFCGQDSPGWILVGMKDPVGCESIPFVETVFSSEAPPPSQLDFAADYCNPWIVHALVTPPFRLRSRRALSELAQRVIESSPEDSPDRGAALCITAYRRLDQNQPPLDQELNEQIAQYLNLRGNKPHVWRWQISLTFVLAKLHLAAGDLAETESLFLRCAGMDFTAFGPQLGTKPTEAALHAGWLAFQRGDHDAAGAAWNTGLSAMYSALSLPLDQLLVLDETPNRFEYGDGLREIAMLVDNAAACANGIHALTDLAAEGRPLRTPVHRNFQTRHAQLLGEVRRMRAENRALRCQLPAAPDDPLEWILRARVGAPTDLHLSRNVEPGLCTVILPVFNNIDFIDRAVESVWKQTLPSDRIELIAVDDGSTDGSLDRLRELAINSPVSMEVLTHPGRNNRGVAPTRNLGFQHARGEFIALLDADDRYLPERLSDGLEYFEAHPECACICSFGVNVDEHGRPTQGYNLTKIAGAYKEVSPDLSPPFTFEQLWEAYPIANSTITVRREALARTGGYPDVMAHQSEDWYLMLLISLEHPIHCIETPLIEYTRHSGSYTELYREKGFAQGARFEVLMYLVQWMIRHPEHREAGRELYRREFPGLISHRETPNLSHLPLIVRNAWKRLRKIGVGGSVRMLRASLREARRKRHG